MSAETAASEVGTWRETKPGYPPYPPPPTPPAFWGCKGERKRVFTLSAFAVGEVSRGLGSRAPRAWGRPTRGLGPFPHKNRPNLSNYDFFANLLVGAWRRRGCRLKRLLRRWGPGGKRSRDTPPTPPKGRGFSPSPPSATIQHAPQGRRKGLGFRV